MGDESEMPDVASLKSSVLRRSLPVVSPQAASKTMPASIPSAQLRSGPSNGNARSAARILVVDDEKTLRDTLTFILQREGFSVTAVGDGMAALRAFRQDPPDLIVLDILLPELDGLQVCRTIRAESTVPILLLSARGEEFDRVLGLEIGADDYLTKPFAMRELVARVRAMLRRAGMPPRSMGARQTDPAGNDNADEPVVAGDLVVDALRRQVTLRGEPINLKPMEFDLLLYFVRRPMVVHSREALLRDVWGYDVPIDTRTVDVHVRWLRQKIEDDPSLPRRIETVRGHGYRFVPDPDV